MVLKIIKQLHAPTLSISQSCFLFMLLQASVNSSQTFFKVALVAFVTMYT